jgi:transposase
MDQWIELRRRIRNRSIALRQISRETGLHQKTLRKIRDNSQPPGYRRAARRSRSKIGPYLDRIKAIIEADKHAPRKQHHTAIKIWQILQHEGFTGSYTIVKDAVRRINQASKEVFMPLSQKPGGAQVDFGHAVVKFDGLLKKVVFFVMSLVYSDAIFVMAFPRECTKAFLEAHLRAFDFFGFIPKRMSYDNTRMAISKIMIRHKRKYTAEFKRLLGHHLFEPHSCNVRRPNEKGVVVRGREVRCRRNIHSGIVIMFKF